MAEKASNAVGCLGAFVCFWLLFSVTRAGLTTFLWLVSHDYNMELAYGISLLSLVPLIGTIVASFMAPSVWQAEPFWSNMTDLWGPYVALGLLAVWQHRRAKKQG